MTTGSPHTFAYDEHLLLQLVGATIEDVSIKERVAYDAVLGALERRIRAAVDWSAYTRLEVLGLDEIALKKGHRGLRDDRDGTFGGWAGGPLGRFAGSGERDGGSLSALDPAAVERDHPYGML